MTDAARAVAGVIVYPDPDTIDSRHDPVLGRISLRRICAHLDLQITSA